MVTSEHPALIKCDPDTIIWRYMDLNKFKSLLKSNSLFFCRSDKFSDPFEGSVPKRESENRITEEFKIARLFKRDTTIEKAQKQSDNIANLHKKVKRAFVVNCWHINTNESDAMWRLYLKTNEGVAIQSTYKRLVGSLDHNEEEFFISKIRYIDYDNNIWYHPKDYPVDGYNLMTPIVHKRNSFSHENELRIFQQIHDAIHDDNYWVTKQSWFRRYLPLLKNQVKTKIGNSIFCDTNKLIQKIILPPTSGNDVEGKVKAIMKQYDLNVEILRSKLDDEPIY